MLRTRYAPFALVLAVLLMAGCAGSKEAAQAPHPLAGAWDWSVDSPQGIYTGVLTFAEAEGMLSGTIAGSEDLTQTLPLEEVMYDSEMSKVTFSFNNPEFGMMNVSLTLDGDALDGLLNVVQMGADVPMTCKRKTMME